MNDNILTIESLSFVYETKDGKLTVLDEIDLVHKKGEWLSLVGPNGAGKTTLGLIIKGLLVPTKGKIRMFSEDPIEDIRRRKAKVGFLFSNPRDQICSFMARDDVAYGLRHLKYTKDEIQKRVDYAMDLLGIGYLANRPTHHLSAGEQQKIALAGVVAMEPEYIILDEPASLLNPKERRDFLRIIERLHEKGQGIVYISSFWEEVSFADRVIVLSKGRVVFSGPPDEFLKEERVYKISGFCFPEIYALSKKLREKIGIPTDTTNDIDHLLYALLNRYREKHG